ncbi:MAB_1171c family putative transporter [Streptomyces sp. NPDC088124]|uniref:MAB_1171c family putative transporter n=1 Tax=Streptomyces sp. NPDC088124 TaxID=3154654 RepID=UPI00341B7414
MSEGTSNIVYLIIAAVEAVIAIWKFTALRRDYTPALVLVASSNVTAFGAFALAAPVTYRAIGDATGRASFATLPVYLCILATFAHFHLITLLWNPALRDKRVSLNRRITGWIGMYGAASLLMIVTFLGAPLTGPAEPLTFNTDRASEPMVLVFLTAFLIALSTGTLSTFQQCRRTRSKDPKVRRALKTLGVSMLFVFGYVLCSAPAIALAAAGNRDLETVGILGSTFGSIGALLSTYGLSDAAFNAWIAERRDLRTLQPLWELTVAGVDEGLAFTAHRPHLMSINASFHLHRQIIEILDGLRALRPWVTSEPAEAVKALHASSTRPVKEAELQAITTAACLKDAAERLTESRQSALAAPVPPLADAIPLPGEDTRAADERRRLLQVARALKHPIVNTAVQTARHMRSKSHKLAQEG